MRHWYKPYHSWRHGFRRERLTRWTVRILWFLMLMGSLRLISGNVHIHLKERIVKAEKEEEHVVGIGINTDSGDVFWFQRRTENVPRQ